MLGNGEFSLEYLFVPMIVTPHDLFTVFNVLQENLIKGGVRGQRLNKYGYTTRTKTREVKAIDQNVKLNRALWTLTEKMMEMKR